MSIAETKELVALLDDILDECADDHVGLWSVLWDVRHALSHASPDEQKSVTLDLLRFLLSHQLIQAGFPAPNGRDFQPWQLSPDEAIEKIAREWGQLGRDPSGGEIVWFTSPEQTP
jgi:hypothetical protein